MSHDPASLSPPAAAALPSPAATAAVRIELIDTAEDAGRAARLMATVWGSQPGASPVSAATMRALRYTGHYVAGAYTADGLVGCAVGFFAAPPARSLHSHAAAVLSGLSGAGIGTALKRHQRDWCLERGVTELTWTFDPTIARNAHLNIGKLGAEPAAYLTDFYGLMDDDRNRGAATDRLLVRWNLVAGAPEWSAEDEASAQTLAIPPDIEALRSTDPALAAHWQRAVRAALEPALGEGRKVRFTRDRGYLISGRGASRP